jgi:hypothetical protein
MTGMTFEEMGTVVERATMRIADLTERLARMTAERDQANAIAEAAWWQNTRLVAELEAMARQLERTHA